MDARNPRGAQDPAAAIIGAVIVALIPFSPFIVPFSVGLSYLVTALAYKNTYIGTLVHSHATKETGARGTYWYVVVEDFARGNSPITCPVKRMHQYDLESEANHAVSKVVIGSQRRIWEYWNKQGHCYDQDIRNYNFAVEITLLAFAFLLLFIVCCCLCVYIKNDESRSNGPHNPMPVDTPRNPRPVYASVEMIPEKEDTGISRV
jgi:hypothetical protein